jgi:quercetin dioxygenase-like cupin family protein
VKEGKIKQTIGTEEKILSAGSIVLAMPGDEHGLSNVGDTNASYYIIKWRTHDFKKQSITAAQSSLMLDWQEFEYKETSKGGRRSVIRQATSMVQELEMHVTTLNEGMTSHAQHTHVDEEIILVLKGEVEELINDKPNKAEAGSLIFLNSMVPHGIRNIGKGQCEYFAIRWIPRN